MDVAHSRLVQMADEFAGKVRGKRAVTASMFNEKQLCQLVLRRIFISNDQSLKHLCTFIFVLRRHFFLSMFVAPHAVWRVERDLFRNMERRV
ncbi:MAG: hypothetical protein QM783_05570 [Phycisphaerales bacterium]